MKRISMETAYEMVQMEIAKWNRAEIKESETSLDDGTIVHKIACADHAVACVILDKERNLKAVVFPVLRLN